MKLIILDRDGVINQDSDDYIKSADEWIPVAGSLEAIARLSKAGYRVIVATNQSGLARGLYDMNELNHIHDKMLNTLADAGGAIDSIFICPHGPDDACGCRKPKPGMFLDIGARLGVRLEGVPAVGDSLRDIEAARSVHAQPILVRTGKGGHTLSNYAGANDLLVYDDLAGVVDDLLKEQWACEQ